MTAEIIQSQKRTNESPNVLLCINLYTSASEFFKVKLHWV